MLFDPSITVEDKHAILHFLDDPLADHSLVFEVDAAPSRQIFVGDDAAC